MSCCKKNHCRLTKKLVKYLHINSLCFRTLKYDREKTGEDKRRREAYTNKNRKIRKKRLAEQRRLEKIRSDPESYADFKAKPRLSYHKRKAAKKILPIGEMRAEEKKLTR